LPTAKVYFNSVSQATGQEITVTFDQLKASLLIKVLISLK